jgi:hypothetical protein
MWSLIKLAITIVCLGLFIWFGLTVKLGKHTLFGHVSRIWKSDEAQDLVQGAKEKAAPVVDEIGQGVKRAMADEAMNPPPAPTPDAGPVLPPDAGAVPMPAKPRKKSQSARP